MAKFNLHTYTDADGIGFPLNFRRGNGHPLDQSELYDSYDAAVEYATNDPVAYVGQVITVLEFSESDTEHTTPIAATVYSIQDTAGTLKEVGSLPVGDGLTVEVVDGKITLKGASTAETGAQPRIKADGSIEWVVPSTETVDGLQTAVAGLQSDVSTLQTDLNAVEAVIGDAESGLVKDVADNASSIESINNKIGTVPDEKTIVEMISEAKAEATYDDTAIVGRIAVIEGDYLKSADKTALETKITQEATKAKTDAIAAIMGEAGIDEKYDTLKEIADWILSDTTASAQLVTRISNIESDYLKGADKTALQGEIDALETLVGTLPEGAVSTNVVAYIKEVVDGLKIGDYAKAADLTALAGRVSTAETKIAALEKVGAEKNIIASVDEAQFAVDAERKLTLLDIAMGKVTGLSDALDGKVDKVEGSRLLTSLEASKLETIVIGENGQVEIVGGINTDNVNGLSELLAGKVDVVAGKGLSANDFTDELLSKLNGIEAGAQVNDLEVVKIAGAALPISDKAVDIPKATTEALGVVLGSAAENKVSVGADGTMEVNSINVDKLTQSEGTALILNGGSSAI